LIAKSFGKSAEFLEIDALEPLWSHPEATGKVLRSLISEPNAPLNPVALVKQRNGTYRLDEMLRSPLVDAPGMRRALVRLLSDRSVIGTVWRRTEREVFYQIGSGMSGGYGIPANSAEDPSLIPAIGVKRPFRACDFIACGLRQYTAMPTFRPYWPEGAKDAAQRRIAARLRNPAHLNSGGLNRPRRYLSFDD
jgi:hypothetical protein